MRVRVDPNGSVLQCIVDRGTGNPAFDFEVCAIVQRRLRYHPGLNENGSGLRIGPAIGRSLHANRKKAQTMIEAEWWDYDSAEELAEAVAGDIGFIIESALDARGSSLIALPGGDTAKPIYQALAAKKLPWKQVTIVPTDERLVADGRRAQQRPRDRSSLPSSRCTRDSDHRRHCRLSAGRKLSGRRLQDLPWPPDLVWLGVGEDGHTAPCSPAPTFRMRSMHPTPAGRSGVMPDPMPGMRRSRGLR